MLFTLYLIKKDKSKVTALVETDEDVILPLAKGWFTQSPDALRVSVFNDSNRSIATFAEDFDFTSSVAKNGQEIENFVNH